jgi:hypothetical protein
VREPAIKKRMQEHCKYCAQSYLHVFNENTKRKKERNIQKSYKEKRKNHKNRERKEEFLQLSFIP